MNDTLDPSPAADMARALALFGCGLLTGALLVFGYARTLAEEQRPTPQETAKEARRCDLYERALLTHLYHGAWLFSLGHTFEFRHERGKWRLQYAPYGSDETEDEWGRWRRKAYIRTFSSMDELLDFADTQHALIGKPETLMPTAPIMLDPFDEEPPLMVSGWDHRWDADQPVPWCAATLR